jgi:membrane protein DedA with SNARE-associated domain
MSPVRYLVLLVLRPALPSAVAGSGLVVAVALCLALRLVAVTVVPLPRPTFLATVGTLPSRRAFRHPWVLVIAVPLASSLGDVVCTVVASA